jgi:dTDP-4-amino-4,6-dideoxygalactose transaminase
MVDQQWAVPLADVRVDEKLAAAADDAIRSGWWSMGPRVVEFEDAFAQFVGAPFAVAVANGTAALHLALVAAGCGPGDEVVVPSLNFVAAANTIVHAGAEPVFCDIRGTTDLNLDPEDVEAAVGPRTRAIVVLHYGGFACDMDAIRELARSRGIAVVEDAAHAPGSTWEGERCGTMGLVGCFSFFSNKNLPVGEGGMIVTADPEIADRLRLLRSHGMTTLTWDRHRGHASSYDVLLHGFNYRLDELRAAIGLVQLHHLPAENAGRARIAARYRDVLHGASGAELAFAERVGDPASSHHLAVLILPDDVDRDRVRELLAKRGVQTSVHYPPIHRFTAYRSRSVQRDLPRTEWAADRLLTLPLFGGMTDSQVELVVEATTDALRQ